MARQLNLEPFRKFVRNIEGRILRTSKQFMERVGKRVTADIEISNQRFFTTFIKKAIDVPAAPNLEEFSPQPWKKLKAKYQKHKDKVAPGAGFFSYKGGLERSLETARGTPILGRPTFRFVKIPQRVAPGQNFRIEIEPAPRLRNVRGINLLEAINSGTKQRSMKLSAYRGRITRPVFDHYLRWWVKYVITPSVVRRLKR